MKFKSNLLCIFSVLSFAFINSAPNAKATAFAFLGAGFLLFISIKYDIFSEKSTSLSSKIFSLAVSSVMGIRFFGSWSSNKFIEGLFNGKETIKTVCLLLTTIILIFGAFFLFCTLTTRTQKTDCQALSEESCFKKIRFSEYVFIFITSVICITLFSKSSPLYPFNDWVDANCFFTVGKSIANGKILYLDIFEQKGPLLYFLYAIAYKISPASFFGVYLLEILFSFGFLLICYKTMLLFCTKKIIFTVPLLSALIYSSSAFTHGGSAEEFCLPVISLVLYMGLKFLVSKKKITIPQWIIIGICSSAVLWIKYTFLGFLIGFFLFFIIEAIRKKEASYLLFSLLCSMGGFIISSIPIILYFILNGAFSELLSVYFYGNIFLYSRDTSNIFNNLYLGIKSFSSHFGTLFALAVSSAVYLFVSKKRCLGFFLCTAISSFFFIYSGGRRYAYYSLILAVFAPLGIILIYKSVLYLFSANIKSFSKSRTKRFIVTFSVFLLCFVYSFLSSPNTYLLKYSKDDMPQFIFDKTISQTEDPTLLNYDFLDGGFYTVSNITPNCKYFCGLNIPLDEIKKTQNHYVEQGLVDFIVTRNEKLPKEISSKYQIVSTADFEFEKKEYTYYLYKHV